MNKIERASWEELADRTPAYALVAFVVALLHKVPLLDDEAVGTDLVIGPSQFKEFTAEVREQTGGIPVGIAAQKAHLRARLPVG
jgi:hypothetical protein